MLNVKFYLIFSDDRSTEVFRNRIESTIQMKATVRDNNKPNCLVIDEIDGAPSVSLFNFS